MAEFRGNKKWSDRVVNCFRSQGKQWNDTMEKRVKLCVAALPPDASLARPFQVLCKFKKLI